jgi:uncharacterized protein (DUF2236 family)
MSEPAPAPDEGLFGPDSISWRVHGEPIMWLAGFRALLLQTLHPRALAGVLQNSRFREDPWGRLLRTARFYGEVVYGPAEQAVASADRVRRIHALMSGTDPSTGERFRVDEPELLCWVYVTATESFCGTAQRAGLGLSPAEMDRYYHEQLIVADLMGLDPETVPSTAAEIDAYYSSMRPQLVADAAAKATARYLAVPSFPWGLGWTPVRPIWVGVAAYAMSLLPPWARRLYGFPGLPTTDLAATMTARTLRAAIRALPTGALEGPIYRAAVARARAASASRNEGATAQMINTSAPGTAKATRRPKGPSIAPISAVPTTTPA